MIVSAARLHGQSLLPRPKFIGAAAQMTISCPASLRCRASPPAADMEKWAHDLNASRRALPLPLLRGRHRRATGAVLNRRTPMRSIGYGGGCLRERRTVDAGALTN